MQMAVLSMLIRQAQRGKTGSTVKLPEHLTKKCNARSLSLRSCIALFFYGFQALVVPVASATQLVSRSSGAAVMANDPVYILHVRQSDETIAEVAKRFDVQEAQLLALQHQMSGYGWSARVLLVPRQDIGESRLYPGYVIHKLRKGETLGSLALSVNRSEQELRSLNTLVMSQAQLQSLAVGDLLLQPAPLTTSAKPSAAEAEQLKRSAQRVEQALVAAAESYSNSLASGQRGAAGSLSPGSVLGQQAEQQVVSAATGAMSQGIEEFLNSSGKAKVGIQANSASKDVNLSLDYLHPLLEDADSILFAQVGARTFDERNIGNLGMGYRHQVNPNLMLGANAFVDQDFSRSHTRGGVGAEVWTDSARLSSNYYTPLSGWKKSREQQLNTDPDRMNLFERAASGWDTRMEASLPGAPELAATAKYFQWKGDGVDAFGSGELAKNPKGYGLGMKWQPMPLFGLSAERQQIQGGQGQWLLGANISWSFDQDLNSQLTAGKGQAIKPLSQARKEFVDRDYNVVLDYKQEAKYSNFRFQSSVINITANASTSSAVIVQSPPLIGVPGSGLIRYEISSVSPASAIGEVTVDALTGALTVAPGAQAQLVMVTARLYMQSIASVDAAPKDVGAQALAVLGSTLERAVEFLVPSALAADVQGIPQGFVEVASASFQSVITAAADSIIDAAAAPKVSVTDITGILQVGQTLTGVYSFNANGGDATDASTMQWLNGGHTDTDTSYLLAADDVGKVLTFEVTAKNGLNVLGNTDSMDTATATGVSGGGTTPPGSIIDPTAPLTVTISGEVGGYPQVDAPLTATVTCVSTCAPLTYEWLIESAISSGNYQPIGGAAANTYTPVGGDQLRKIKVRVSN